MTLTSYLEGCELNFKITAAHLLVNDDSHIFSLHGSLKGPI